MGNGIGPDAVFEALHRKIKYDKLINNTHIGFRILQKGRVSFMVDEDEKGVYVYLPVPMDKEVSAVTYTDMMIGIQQALIEAGIKYDVKEEATNEFDTFTFRIKD